MIKVYVKTDSNNVIVEINSDVFLENTEGWVCIDEGNGDKYAHAQANYLPKDVVDDKERYNFKLEGNDIVELTEDEKLALFGAYKPVKTDKEKFEERLSKLEGLFKSLEV